MIHIIGISKTLEWQFCNIRNDASNGVKKRNFGIRYYSIESLGPKIVDVPGTESRTSQGSFSGLVVFLCTESEVELYIEQIVPIVKDDKLPFILCLKHTNTDDMEKTTVAIKILQSSLDKTHLIIRTIGTGMLYYPSN